MQLIISQVVYVQDSQAGIQCCLSADVLSAIEYPHLQGAAVPRLSSPARQLWELLLLIYNFGLMLFLEGLGKCLSCSTIPAWAVAGSSTLSHSRRSESLLGNGSKIPACATQELGDCFSFISFPFFIFFFLLAAICCAQLPWLGGDEAADSQSGQEGRKSTTWSLACLQGRWGWQGGWPGGCWWHMVPSRFVHHREKICSALLFAHSYVVWVAKWQKGNKWDFWYLSKMLCNLPAVPSLHTQSQREVISLPCSHPTTILAVKSLGLFP